MKWAKRGCCIITIPRSGAIPNAHWFCSESGLGCHCAISVTVMKISGAPTTSTKQVVEGISYDMGGLQSCSASFYLKIENLNQNSL